MKIMRLSVSRFAFLFSLVAFHASSLSAQNDYGGLNGFASKCQSATSSAGAEASGLICGDAREVFCQEATGNNGCSSSSRNQTFTVGNFKPAQARTPVSKGQQLCQNYESQARNCINGSNCRLSDGTARNLDSFASTAPAKETMLAGATQLETRAQEEARIAASFAGAAFARSQVCVVECSRIYQELKRKCPTCSSQLDPVNRHVRNCEALLDRAQDSYATVKQRLETRDGSQRSREAYQNLEDKADQTGSIGSGKDASNPPGAKNEQAKGTSGKGIGDMLNDPTAQSVIGGFLRALTSQEQEDDAYEPEPDMGMAACSDTDPNSRFYPHCQQAANDSWNKDQGESGQMQGQSGAAENFNVPDPGNLGGAQPQSLGGGGGGDDPAKSATVPVGGSQMLGSAQTGGASLGGGGGGGGNPGGPGAASKLEISEKGGSAIGGITMTTGATGGYGGYDRGTGNSDRGLAGMNMAEFLPGGAKYAGRKAAGLGTDNYEIQSKEVNIWQRISMRIRARCTQGLLKDCGP